jgi:hypothetical protein
MFEHYSRKIKKDRKIRGKNMVINEVSLWS